MTTLEASCFANVFALFLNSTIWKIRLRLKIRKNEKILLIKYDLLNFRQWRSRNQGYENYGCWKFRRPSADSTKTNLLGASPVRSGRVSTLSERRAGKITSKSMCEPHFRAILFRTRKYQFLPTTQRC